MLKKKCIPENVKIDVPKPAQDFKTASTIKKYIIKYPMYTFNINSWGKFEGNKKVIVKKVGRLNVFTIILMETVKDISQ